MNHYSQSVKYGDDLSVYPWVNRAQKYDIYTNNRILLSLKRKEILTIVTTQMNLKDIMLSDQIANIRWIIEKAREFQKNIYFCFIDYAKAFDCVDHNNLWKILKEMGIPDHLTCLLRNRYAGQEATVRTGHGTTDWFQIGKGVHQAVYCHPAYLTSMQSTS